MLKKDQDGPESSPLRDRHLTITPIDMRQPRFGSAVRGFNRVEVTAFLEEAAGDYENALRENDRLRQDVQRLEASLDQYRELEGSLKSTLMTAQKVADDMRENATQEAGRIVREAEGRAELALGKAQARLEEVQREVDGLRLKRREAQTSLEATIATLRNALEFAREQDRREHDTRVVPHRPAAATSQSA